MKKAAGSITKKEFLFLTLCLVSCFIFYFVWSLNNAFNTSPDEGMRFDVIRYIYETGIIPDGFTEEIRTATYGYSYAFFPTFLGALLSTAFMHIAAVFSTEQGVLLMAARMTSLLGSIFALFFFYLSLRKLFSVRVSAVCLTMTAMMPQYAYLSTYVNNDIICIWGSSLVLYGWLCVFEKGWTVFSTLMTGSGIVVIALSYYNGGAWILMSILFFFTGFYWHKGQGIWSYDRMKKMCALIVGFVFVCVGYFYIRNIILYNGDMFGIRAMSESGRLYGLPMLYPENRPTGHNMGISLLHFLLYPTVLNVSWLALSFLSFVGVLGPMNIILPIIFYIFYLIIFLIGVLAFLVDFGCQSKKMRNLQQGSEERIKAKMYILFRVMLIVCIVTPFCLSVYYSYFMDYQSQGRYIYPGLTAFIVILGFGMTKIIDSVQSFALKRGKNLDFILNLGLALLILLMIGICLYSYFGAYLPHYAAVAAAPAS